MSVEAEPATGWPRAASSLTIVQALAKGSPIRRREWARANGARINYDTVFGPQWITLGEKKDGLTRVRHLWIVVATGYEVTLSREDYVALDWEAQS